MSYRNPKTGEVYDDIKDALEHYCPAKDSRDVDACKRCAIGSSKNTDDTICTDFSVDQPAEAAHLMGYEVIDETPTVSGDRPTEEENMDKMDKPLSEWTLGEMKAFCKARQESQNWAETGDECVECPFNVVCCAEPEEWTMENSTAQWPADATGKPRLAEVLGVEVEEQFRIGDIGCDFWIEADGWPCSELFNSNASAKWVVNAINHPECIIRIPQLTEPEIAIMRAVGAKWVSRDLTGESVDLWSSRPIREGGIFLGSGDNK